MLCSAAGMSMWLRQTLTIWLVAFLLDFFKKSKKPHHFRNGAFLINSLTMSYFHTGIRTIIGAEAFHCPVRDGKEWDHLAMVIRLNRSPSCNYCKTANL